MSASGELASLVLFWSSAGLLAYTYAGFWIVLAARAWLWPRPVVMGTGTPPVSLLIAAHNEAAVIASKLDNILALDYPPDRLEIIVASDGSDDGTAEIVASYAARGVRLLRLPRRGKNATVAAAAAAAHGDVLVFTDADVVLARDAVRRLAAAFAQAEVGAAAGDFRYTATAADAAGERRYWSYDRELKRLQSRGGSLTAVSGALYAVRRELFVAPPAGVTDDFFITAQVAAAHRRVVFVPQALALGPPITGLSEAFERRVRVVARGLRAIWLCRRLLNPRTYGWYSVQLLSHKVMRRFMVLPLIGLLLSAMVLWPAGRLYQAAALAQLLFHAGAAVGGVLQRRGRRLPGLLRLVLHFDLMNLACLFAYALLATGRRLDVWYSVRANAKVESR